MRRRTHIAAVLLLGSALLAAAPLRASDDGGLRSVFALGAGNRALGLGGAYAAVADDASAALWNPAGLAALKRRHVQFTGSNLIGMGFSEQYLSVAYPHWRHGNVSVTVRLFGVDGIEHRDDRNVLLGDDLKDQEFEVLLAYARPLRSGLSVGGGFKLQRQSLAGYSGGGVGIDLGVLAAPLVLGGGSGPAAEAWTLGLGLRNLLEPSIRLDAEDVPDPRALRLGTAYRRPLGRDLAGLAALDFEKTAGMDTRLHVGAEVDYRRLAALRLGLLDGSLTAGFGVRWRDVAIDFAFEDHVLGPVKRIGLSLLQGRPVDEIRAEAQARAATERRRQLEAAFAEAERTRRQELHDAAQTAFAAGDHAGALDQLSMLQLLDPEHAEAMRLEIEVLRDLARVQETQGELASAIITLGRLAGRAPDDEGIRADLTRLREQSAASAQRSLEIESLYTDGLDAFAAGDLDDAQRSFEQARRLAPEDEDVADMLARVERARAQQLSTACDETRSLTRAGLVDEAAAALARVEAMGASAATLATLRQGLDDRRRQIDYERRSRAREREMAAQLAALESPERTSPETSAPVSAAISASRRDELAALTRRAHELFDAGDADEAVRIWELVWGEDPANADASEALREEYLTRGMAAYAAGDLSGAVKDWEQALRVAPNDPRTQGYLDRARQQQARIRALQDENDDAGGER